MTASPGLIGLLKDLLAPLGTISVRRMFGGAGIYCDAQVFAFIDDDTLFLKTDESGRATFEAEGMGPFTYMTKDGPGTLMTYWRAPERLLDEPEEMIQWAQRAVAVARSTAALKKARRRGGTLAKAPREPRSRGARTRS